MASLDLSAAFNFKNVELLIKRLRITGLADKESCKFDHDLAYRHFVELNGQYSATYESYTGTIQGSVFGTMLYPVFVYSFLT
jgi:hypothetical protein